MALVDLFTSATPAEIKAKVAGFADTAKLFLTSWYPGAPGEQLYQAFTQAISFYVGGNAQIVRGFFLDLATDPGDEDPYDPTNALLEPAPGFLSALGLNCFLTTRPGATFATTILTVQNTTAFPTAPFAPGALTFARVGASEVTFRNSPDPTIYTGPGGTTFVMPGGTLQLPVSAETPGTRYSCVVGELTVSVTLAALTVTVAPAALGTDRMSAPNYRALCRTQATATSPNGASDAFRRAATTNIDGTPLLQSLTATPAGDGLTPVGVTKIYISPGSVTGIVTVYYADDDSAASAVDVATANENIALITISVPGTITFAGLAAINVNVTPTWAVEYSAKYRGAPVSPTDLDALIKAALTDRFKEYPIGGFSQTLGAGTIPLEDIRSTVHGAHPAIRNVVMSSPAGATALALGRVARLVGGSGTYTAVTP